MAANLAASSIAEQVIGLLQSGVDLQASIGSEVISRKFIRAGEVITANGRQVTAPSTGMSFIEKSRLREISIVAVAADASSSVSLAASKGPQLPEPEETIHIVMSGRFALWDFVPAVLGLAGCSIDTLTVCTLGFSRRNVVKLAELVDRGDIGTVCMIYSHYFSKTTPTLASYADEVFAARSDRMQLLAARSHAKILLCGLADGRRLTFESSANLRSCKNIEQCAIFGSPDLYAFHRTWIDSLFRSAGHDGTADRAS